MVYTKQHAEFLTVTCLEWKNVLQADRFKDVITNSLTFLTDADRVSVYAFVIMPNQSMLLQGDYEGAGNYRGGIFGEQISTGLSIVTQRTTTILKVAVKGGFHAREG